MYVNVLTKTASGPLEVESVFFKKKKIILCPFYCTDRLKIKREMSIDW